ncbi:MAG: pseudouridine synthase [Christensenellaceae bacterium]|jgi:23S rRNA pseudouridine2605 synthase
MRLQKFMADAGIASRRKCEELILRGGVEVNGKTVREMGFLVNPAKDIVKYQGKRIVARNNKVYIMLNKPAGVVCTCRDDRGRQTVMQFIKDIPERLFPVGRLDFTSEGLLIMTNDGELANVLTHPKHNVPKKYLAVIDSEVLEEDLRMLEGGVSIDGRKTAPAICKLLSASSDRSEVLVIIFEGRNRQIRKMFDAIDKNVRYLKRVAIGDIGLGNLKKGKYRELTKSEVEYLKKIR